VCARARARVCVCVCVRCAWVCLFVCVHVCGSLGSVSCIFKDFSYMAKHQIFTIAPIFVILLLVVPSALATFLSKWNIRAVEPRVIEELISAFFFAAL